MIAVSILARLYNRLPGSVQHALLTAGHHRLLVGVVGVGIDAFGNVVLGRHRFGTSAWRLLGGILGKHEDPAVALAREIREETGSVAIVGPVLHAGGSAQRAHVEIVFAYRVEGPIAVVATDELLEVGTFPLDALPPMRPDHRWLIDHLGAAAKAWALSEGRR